eukprot:TRINITY_DN32761_c0_g1_i1.p1 TRINITY_DN32761_c0_g1~~TRINITY_DN32761_c0_g1_i1.p1  ORF type:complete len:299 (-),score=65.42 TRINITY_DN32761_c0_g1_i1:12-908(-)
MDAAADRATSEAPASEPPQPASSADVQSPRVVLDLEDAIVVEKPANWQVDDRLNERSDPGQQAAGLSEFLAATLSTRDAVILRDDQWERGFLHRLDVPSSGLVLVAKRYESYLRLQIQLCTGKMQREYALLCHGWMSPSRQRIDASVHWVEGSSVRSSAGEDFGRSATTMTKVLGHVGSRRQRAYSIVAVQLVTGRKHQIRVHTAHLGHPTVCDGQYTAKATFLEDLRECPRNFLHRYRLGFRDSKGLDREAVSPIPADLLDMLRALQARPGQSVGVLRRLRGRGALTAWDALEKMSL